MAEMTAQDNMELSRKEHWVPDKNMTVKDTRGRGVEVRLARVHPLVLERLRASGVIADLGEEQLFRRVEDAVEARS